MVDTIISQNIFELLNNELKNKIEFQVLDKATSTNTLVKELATEKNEGFVMVAGEQTAGRGRMGRSFFSPGDSGVYMSLLLKPQIHAEEWFLAKNVQTEQNSSVTEIELYIPSPLGDLCIKRRYFLHLKGIITARV